MTVKEKATVPNPSVDANGEQSLNKNTKKIIANLEKQNNQQATKNKGKCPIVAGQDALETISMEEMYDTIYPPKIPIVDGLIYNGTYLFVGAPKVGKSFFYGTTWISC